MKALLLGALLSLLPGGDREKGLQLYREGRFAEAATAFRAAIQSDGDSAELQWNLALANWRAGDPSAAETAAEKYAALATEVRADLHRGLLGAVRYDEARALEAKSEAVTPQGAAPQGMAPGAPDPAAAAAQDPLPLLEQALEKAVQAKDHFTAGAASKPTAELLRNTERTLRYVEALQKKVDELKKQREEQKKDEPKQDDKKDEEKKDDKDDEKGEQKKPGEDKDESKEKQPKDDKQKPDQDKEGKEQDGKDAEPKPEPKPEQGEPKPTEQKPEPAKDEAQKPEQPEPKPGEQQPRSDAPGEIAEGKELSSEQTQRLMEQLKDLDKKLKGLRVRAKSGRPPVERDW